MPGLYSKPVNLRSATAVIARGAWRGFAVGYGLNAAIRILLLLLNPRKWGVKALLRVLSSQYLLQYGAFMAAFAAIYRGMRLLATQCGPQSRLGKALKALAGPMSGLSILLAPKEETFSIATTSLARSLYLVR